MARILIIDDDPALRTLLSYGLMQVGHTVEEAGDGVEGYRAYARGRQDLILCDIMMPNKEGLETIKELKREFPSVQIIAMSGGLGIGTMNPLQIALRLGARKYLEKPFSLDEMTSLVNELLATVAKDRESR